MTTFINLFGGPGTGKSTNALRLAHYLKTRGENVELVTEVAKDFVWEGRMETLNIQPYITIKQYRNLVRLKGKVDYVITDAPILLGICYSELFPSAVDRTYQDFIHDLHKKMLCPAINIVLKRTFKYDTNGRYQSEEDAIKIDNMILDMLDRYEVPFSHPTQDIVFDIGEIIKFKDEQK